MKNLDSRETFQKHKKLIVTKYFLNNIYIDFYNKFKKKRYPPGKIIELGSGAGFIKNIIPKTITSDVLKGPGIDMVFFAEKMPFKNSTIAGFIMVDVFHHIKNPKLALKEMERCLKFGGKVVMIEPYNSPWGKFIYTYFHREVFDANSGWKIKGTGRLTDANIAIPWIIFVRDKEKYQNLFPNLIIKSIKPHTPLRYLFSGGLSKYQFLPNIFYKPIEYLENLLTPLFPYLGMFATIELEKVSHKQR